ncbi:MAG: tRNA lysidine(34) synthetase TilS, partial [Pseudomonadota bacterium]
MCAQLIFENETSSMLPSLDPRKLFSNVVSDSPVIVAVSGGGDSVALLLLAAAWARQSDVELQVVTVDHGLRPEAAAEAAFVAGISEGLDLPHITLAWDGLKPDSGLSEAARNARYTLLEEFARDISASAILVGHTLDDQAETIYMRNSRGSGNGQGRGLSGMSSYMLLPRGTRLFRPLLGVYRRQLRQYLTEHHQSWIEDPSNQDASYERVRVRQKLETLPPVELAGICRFGELMGRMRQVLATEVASALTENLQID